MTDEERAKAIIEHGCDLDCKMNCNLKDVIADALRAERQRTLESEVVKNLADALNRVRTFASGSPNYITEALAAYDAALKKGDL